MPRLNTEPPALQSRPTWRVLLLAPQLHAGQGGIEVFSRALLAALARSPHVERLALGVKNDPPATLAAQDFPVEVCWGDGDRRAGGLRTAAFGVGVLAACRRWRPDLIVSTHIHFAPLARTAQRLWNTPFWLVGHGVDLWRLDKPSVRRALSSAERMLCVSRFSRDYCAREWGLPSAQLTVFPNTFDAQRFSPGPKPTELLRRYHLRPDQPVVLSVSRLAEASRNKGYDRVLRALPAVVREIPDVRYVLVGQGPDRPRIEALVESLGLSRQVTLAGFVPEDELADHYRLCDLFALPSLDEGFGIVFLEALGCGKPVLAGNRDGSGEPLLDGELGVLLNPDDTAALALQMTQILRGEHPLKSLAQPDLLRRTAIEKFGAAAFQARLDALLAASTSRLASVGAER